MEINDKRVTISDDKEVLVIEGPDVDGETRIISFTGEEIEKLRKYLDINK